MEGSACDTIEGVVDGTRALSNVGGSVCTFGNEGVVVCCCGTACYPNDAVVVGVTKALSVVVANQVTLQRQ